MAQAFYTVWQDSLLFKLKNIFPAPYYLLLKSDLSDRSFRVKINTTLYSLQMISAGVPQGSYHSFPLYFIRSRHPYLSQYPHQGLRWRHSRTLFQSRHSWSKSPTSKPLGHPSPLVQIIENQGQRLQISSCNICTPPGSTTLSNVQQWNYTSD